MYIYNNFHKFILIFNYLNQNVYESVRTYNGYGTKAMTVSTRFLSMGGCLGVNSACSKCKIHLNTRRIRHGLCYRDKTHSLERR